MFKLIGLETTKGLFDWTLISCRFCEDDGRKLGSSFGLFPNDKSIAPGEASAALGESVLQGITINSQR